MTFLQFLLTLAINLLTLIMPGGVAVYVAVRLALKHTPWKPLVIHNVREM